MLLVSNCSIALDGLGKEELENNLVDQASSSKMHNITKKVYNCTIKTKLIFKRSISAYYFS